jgi:hypothetical protein
MKSYCNQCNRPTNHNVLKKEKTQYSEQDGGWWEESEYQIIQCGGCDQVSFRTLYTDAQIQQQSDEDDIYIVELFPKRGPNSIPIKSFNNLPYNVKGIYRETIDAFNNEQLILCCGGLRALIEGICLDKSIKGIIKKNKKGADYLQDNLEGKIEGLSEKGYLTKDNATSLHELRFLGNEALHELTKPTIQEIKLAIEIIELTVENIYEIQHKALKLKRQKANRQKE